MSHSGQDDKSSWSCADAAPRYVDLPTAWVARTPSVVSASWAESRVKQSGRWPS